MALTPKGKKTKAAMVKEYGKEKGERVFYASENSGQLKGVSESKQNTKPKGRRSKAKRK